MRIGDVAERAGVSVRSIRHYEREGLVAATRRDNGYRDFDDSAVGRVRVVRDLLETGFTVAEVRSLAPCLDGAADDGRCCERTIALYREKLARIDAQVRTLTGLRHRIVARMAALEPCAAPVPVLSTNPGAGGSPRLQTRRSA
jgi:DNA-binding transcriptional MerR regulator